MDSARSGRRGVGAFNVIHLETAEGLVSAAERSGLPLILQISENCIRFHGGLDPVAQATLAMARSSGAELVVHLDHARDEALALAAIDSGFGSIMFDGSALPYEENVIVTARVAARAHAAGVYVEGELGEVAGKNGAHAPGVRTDPQEARSFVAATGVDSLAVAVGSEHAMRDREARLDLALVSALRDALEVPLVLHGSSGVDDAHIVEAIAAGMTKINVSTHLNGFFTRAIRRYLTENPAVVDSRAYIGAARTALGDEAERMLRLFAMPASS